MEHGLPNGTRFTRQLLGVLIVVAIAAVALASVQTITLRDFHRESVIALERNYVATQGTGAALEQVASSINALRNETRETRELVERMMGQHGGPERDNGNGGR